MLLGGHARDRIRVYRGIGGRDGIEAADQAHRLHEEWGFTAFKTSPYQLDPDANRWGASVMPLRPILSKYERILHRNGSLPSIRTPKSLNRFGHSNSQMPLPPTIHISTRSPLRPEHIPAWSRLRAQMQVPLQRENPLYTRFEFLDLICGQGADIIQPDICVCGGLLEMRKIAAIAEAHYVSIAPHNPMGPLATAVNVHFAAATPNFKILEYLLPTETEWNDWIDEPYLPKEGYLELRDRPGLGVEVNEAAITDNEYIHWQPYLPYPSRWFNRLYLVISCQLE